MDHWIIPVTIIPGIGLLILSTTNLWIGLSDEIDRFIKEDPRKNDWYIRVKIRQLRLLNISMICLYLGAALFSVAGLAGAFLDGASGGGEAMVLYLEMTALLSLLVSIVLLVIYSIHAVKIKNSQFNRSL